MPKGEYKLNFLWDKSKYSGIKVIWKKDMNINKLIKILYISNSKPLCINPKLTYNIIPIKIQCLIIRIISISIKLLELNALNKA